MFKAIAVLTLSCLVFGCSSMERPRDFAGRSPAGQQVGGPSKRFQKFERALVLEGGFFNAAIGVGVYDAMVDGGKKPDVLISSCGSSIANGIINAIPDRQERLKYLLSEDFYSMLKDVSFRDPRLSSSIGGFLKQLHSRPDPRGLGPTETIPPLFDHYLLEVGRITSQPLVRKYFSEDDATRSVILGGRVLFTPKEVGNRTNGRRLYEEVYFTDPGTARALEQFISPVALAFPESPVQFKTSTQTNVSIADAIRISVSDPYLMAPAEVNGEYYVAGTLDLYPLEVAYQLADEVATVFPSAFADIEQRVIGTSIGIDNNARLRQYTGMYARYWIDYSDFSENSNDLFATKRTLFLKNQIETDVPKNIGEFKRKVMAQWHVGYERGKEALSQLPNSKLHIRGMNSGNASTGVILGAKRHKDYSLRNPGWVQEILK